MLERGREAVAELLNSEGRSGGHVALGLLLCAGAVALSAAAGAGGARRVDRHGLRRPGRPGDDAVVEAPRSLLAIAGPALLSATTLSAVRVWNAPDTAARSRALGLWALLQGLNGVWMALRPRGLPQQVASAMIVAGVTAAYAHEARKLDKKAATIVAPVVGRAALGNLMSDLGHHRHEARPTVH